MDISREILNTLMGRDRNKPKDKITTRDHYSNRDVCKPFLVCFCFNTLFPNTVYDQGPCTKRHDAYLKTMFDNDLTKSQHEKDYIHWIDKRLIDVEQKIKKNQGVIDNKSSYTTDRPKQVLDRIIAIDQDIEKMMHQAQTFGENGQIDDSSRCLEEVQRLRERRKEIELMGDNMMTTQKQQKICDICGAIQTINDTEKRIQTHLQGKIHQGFLKLRHQVKTLRMRLEMLSSLDGAKKEKDNQPYHNSLQEKVRLPSQNQIKIEKERDRSHSKKKKKDYEKERENREKDRYRQRQYQYSKQTHKKDKEKDKQRERHREKDRQHKDKDYDHQKEKKDHHKKKHKKERSRSRDKQEKQDKHEKHSYYS